MLVAAAQEGRQQDNAGILFYEGGFDVTDPATLTADRFKGVTQVVSCLGPVVGPLPEGARLGFVLFCYCFYYFT